MTAFQQLYQHCQTLKIKISTNEIQAKIIELTGCEDVMTVKDALENKIARGYFLSASNKDHPLVKQNGCNMIVLARGMTDCWDRFIKTKELLHLLDSDESKTNSPEAFNTLLSEFEALDASDISLQFRSEIDSIWMALACLCPEANRIEFVEQAKRGHIDHYGIALKLRIPEHHIRHLLRDDFKQIIDRILSQ